MGVGTSASLSLPHPNYICCSPSSTLSAYKPKPLFPLNPTTQFSLKNPTNWHSLSSSFLPLKCGGVDIGQSQTENNAETMGIVRNLNPDLLQQMLYDALVWCSLHGLVVGDKNVQKSGIIPGVGLVHAPFALMPTPFPQVHWQQACDLTCILNELVDRVSMDGDFLQASLSRTKKVDAFTSRLLDIHSEMLGKNKKEEIRLGLHRSDYMLDDQTKDLLQIELNTISSSFPGLGCLTTELHRNLINHYGGHLGLHSERVPENAAVTEYAEALAQAWKAYNKSSAVIMIVVQTEERNMYDQHWLSTVLRERCGVKTIRRTMAEIDSEGELLADETLIVDGQEVAVIYFRAGYAPIDYPSETEWKARILMEHSTAVKCPSISYHLAGTKKVQQELAKPNVLERFLENKDDIVKVRKCFAGLWSLEDSNAVRNAIEKPEHFVLKPQREGGGNNIYDINVRETLQKLQDGSEEQAAYILMQRIFPIASPTFLVREGVCNQELAISELGIYGAYLRNKDKVIMNAQCGYLMRTKVSSSNEGGVAAGYGVLDSIYLT